MHHWSKGQVSLPDAIPYNTLSNIEVIYDSTGLARSTNNSYGQVDSDYNIGASGWKSLAPGKTGLDLTVVNSNVNSVNPIGIQIINNIPVVDANGYGLLRNVGGSTSFDFFNNRASFATLKWTIHCLLRPGMGSNPNQLLGICGNTSGASTSKGMWWLYDDRSLSSKSDGLTLELMRGVSSSYNHRTNTNSGVFNPNAWQVVTIEFDGSLVIADRLKCWINGVAVTQTNVFQSSTLGTPPTYDFELFATGNGAFPFNGQISHFIAQSGIETSTVRDNFISSLALWRDALNASKSNRLHVYDVFDDNRYYLATALCQNPTNTNTIVQVFSDGTSHLAQTTKKLSMRKSTDKGLTWSGKTTVLDPVNSLAVQDCLGGYTSTGRLIVATDIHTVVATWGAPHFLNVLYSDDDGTSWTTLDITSVLPSDGLASWRCIGEVIQNGSRVMFQLYKFLDEGNTTQSANYLIYSEDDGLTWNYKTIRAISGTYTNEGSLLALNSTNLICQVRNESTKEWTMFSSSDNGDTWTNNGDINFGETLTSAGPCSLNKFTLNGTSVAVCYYIDRVNRVMKAVYAKTSDLVANPVTAWDVDTKTIIVPDYVLYGHVVHYDGDINAIGCYPREPNPVTLTENELWSFYLPTNHQSVITSQLGI